jgi:hypothetical protein
MAIRRCPYCKAIIDESQKYCNNCGTQLLFPEDERIVEDIKGEKIVDDDFKDEDEDEDLEESPDAPEDEDAHREVIDLEEVPEGGSGFPDELGPGKKSAAGDDDDLAEDPEKIEEDLPPLPAPRRGRPKKEIPPSAPPPPPVPTKAPSRRPMSSFGPPSVPVPLANVPPPPVEPPVSVTPDEPESSEHRNDEADTKEEIARLLGALEKKHQRAKVSDTGEKIIAPLDASSDLPPWSDLSHDTSDSEPAEAETGEKAEASSFVPGDTMDFQDEVMRRAEAAAPPKSTIGMPEAPVKPRTAILFERDEDEPAAAASPAVPSPAPVIRRKTEDFETEEAPNKVEIELPSRARLGFFRRIAATFFDLVFVALFWAAAVGLGAMLMDAAAPDLVQAAVFPLGLLFAVLFAGYLFLFFFFLGETLGGRLLSRRDAA